MQLSILVGFHGSEIERMCFEAKRPMKSRRLLKQTWGGLLLTVALGVPHFASGEDEFAFGGTERSPLNIQRLSNEVDVQIDGVINESAWSEASEITDLRLVNRAVDDMPPIPHSTSVRVFYNDRGLYVAFVMEQPTESFVKIYSAPDGGSLARDFVTVAIDASGAGKYGFYFTQFLGGSTRDGQLQPEKFWRSNWDGAWYGRTTYDDKGWYAEFLIPWSILNMPHAESARSIGLLVSRKLAKSGDYYSWPAIHDAEQRFLSDLRPIVLQDVEPRAQLSLIPFVSSNIDMAGDDTDQRVGMDVFWRPTTNFQATGVLQPDFGTVEADDVIINLSFFETFFPEKRLFFTEGQELFNLVRPWGGNSFIVPFHSRRIGERRSLYGIVPTSVVDLPTGSDLTWAAKGVGEYGKWRYGLLTAWEDDLTVWSSGIRPQSYEIPGREFQVVRLLYEDETSGSLNLGLLSTSRQDSALGNAYSHTVNLNYATEDSKFGADARLSTSNVVNQATGFGGYVDLFFQTAPTRSHVVSIQSIDENLNLNALGFNARTDRTQLSYGYRFQDLDPQRFRAVHTSIGVVGSFNSDGRRTGTNISVSRDFNLQQLHVASIKIDLQPSYLNDSVAYQRAKFEARTTLAVDGNWSTDNTQPLYYSLNTGYRMGVVEGGFFYTGGSLTYQPIENFRLNFAFSKGWRDGWVRIRAPNRFTRFHSWGPRASLYSEYFFTPRQQVRVDFQWQTIQAKGVEHYMLTAGSDKLVSTGPAGPDRPDNFASSGLKLQLRYRWTIAPMSNLYLVFTETGYSTVITDNSMVSTLRELLRDADTVNFAAKFRYRFGN